MIVVKTGGRGIKYKGLTENVMITFGIKHSHQNYDCKKLVSCFLANIGVW